MAANGFILEVSITHKGSELVSAVLAGATQIEVLDTAPFINANGEQATEVEIAGDAFGLTAVDPSTGLLTLSSGLPGPLEEGTGVFPLPAVMEKWAMVEVRDLDEPLAALVGGDLYDRITDGVRDPEEQESVSVDIVNGDWVVTNILGEEPTTDGTFLADETVGSSALGIAAVTAEKVADGAIISSKLADLVVTAEKLADGAIGAGKIAPGVVTYTELADGAVGPSKLADLAVTAQKIADGSVVPGKIAAGAVTGSELADGAVGSAELADSSVGSSKLADLAVTAGKIADGTISTPKLADLAVSSTKIADDAITTPKIAAGAVTAAEIAADTITAGQIAAGAIGTAEIAAGAVTADRIGANTITAGQIAAGAIGTNQLAANAVTAAKIAADTITAGQISAGAIGTAEIAAGAVTADRIASGTITADQIAAGAITSVQIAADTITAGQLAAGAIGVDELAANAVTADKLAGESVTADKLAANSVIAGKIAAGAVTAEALNVVSTDAASGQQLTLQPDGLRVLSDEGESIVAITSAPPNYISVSADGSVMASMSETGVISGSTLSAVLDVNVGGDDLVGEFNFPSPSDNPPNGLLASLPYGVVAFDSAVSNWSWTSGNTQAVRELSFLAQANRSYRVTVGGGLASGSTAGQAFGLIVRRTLPANIGEVAPTPTFENGEVLGWAYTSSGSANELSRIPPLIRVLRCNTTGDRSVGGELVAGINKLLIAGTNAGTAWAWYNNSANPLQVIVEDIGPDVPINGKYNGSKPGTPTGDTTTTTTYTRTYTAAWSQTYQGDGSKNTVSGNDVYQGYYSSTNGNQKSLVGAPSAMLSELAAADTIKKIEVYLYFYHWYNNSGGTAVLGHTGATSEPTSFSGAVDQWRVSNWPKPGGKWVTVPSSYYSSWKNGTYAGVALGPGPTTGSLYYGKAYGTSGSYPAKFRVTYTKTT